MSNALAVAHVTQALALLIESNLRPEIDMAVSVETRKPPADPPADPTITVFLYQVTHNPSMRNHDLPTRASDGTLLNKPVAALDLHYVISAYGEENELVGQRLMGCVARILREFPVLPADVIEEAGERPYLAGSDLAEAEQKVRFTPLQMDIDETSKLWGMLHQTPYSLSMPYQASLVLVEGRDEPERSRPVRRTEVTVGANSRPPQGRSDGADGQDAAPGPAAKTTAAKKQSETRREAESSAAKQGATKPSGGVKKGAPKATADKPAAKKATTKKATTKKSVAKKQPRTGRSAPPPVRGTERSATSDRNQTFDGEER